MPRGFWIDDFRMRDSDQRIRTDSGNSTNSNRLEPMNVLVTGGAGFIGSHLADAYLAAGHRVVILDNLSTGSPDNINPAARFVEGDVRDADLVNALFMEEKFDLVNHHAAQLDVRISVANPAFDAEQNIIGSVNIFQAAVATGVGRALFASSGGTVYGEQNAFPADETHSTEPISPYGVSKLSVEKYLGYFAHQFGLRFAVLRYTNVYGPRQSSHGEAGVVAIFCDRMLSGNQPVINGTGLQTRDYVFVEDVARANLLATAYLEKEERGIFNVCSNTEVTVNELFQSLNRIFDDRFAEEHGPAKPGEQFRSVCSYAKAEAVLGWKPQVDFNEGLRRTVEFFKVRSR